MIRIILKSAEIGGGASMACNVLATTGARLSYCEEISPRITHFNRGTINYHGRAGERLPAHVK